MAELVLPKSGIVPALKGLDMFHYWPVSPALEKVVFEKASRQIGGKTRLAKISYRLVDEILRGCRMKSGEELRLLPGARKKLYLTMRILLVNPEIKTVEVKITFPIGKAVYSVGWKEGELDWRPYIIENIIGTWHLNDVWVRRDGGSDATMIVSLEGDDAPRAFPIPDGGYYYVMEKEYKEDPDSVKAMAEKIRDERQRVLNGKSKTLSA